MIPAHWLARGGGDSDTAKRSAITKTSRPSPPVVIRHDGVTAKFFLDFTGCESGQQPQWVWGIEDGGTVVTFASLDDAIAYAESNIEYRREVPKAVGV